jgi:hypothetical protein
MVSVNKGFLLFVIAILAVSSLIVAKSACAQSIPKPSIPEFTVKFVDTSYNVPASSSIDPYTGQNVTTEGHRVENRTIELTIKNQPFVSYISNDGNISFYLNVREKGHYETEDKWIDIYAADNHYTSESNTDYTTLTYSLDPDVPPWLNNNILSGGQLDFQVEALIGHIGRTSGFASWYFNGEESGWSSTQTITIPANETTAAPSTSLSPTTSVTTEPSGSQTPALSGLDLLQVTVVALLVVIAVLLGLVVVYLRKRSLK